jgi:hypothetical protein
LVDPVCDAGFPDGSYVTWSGAEGETIENLHDLLIGGQVAVGFYGCGRRNGRWVPS